MHLNFHRLFYKKNWQKFATQNWETNLTLQDNLKILNSSTQGLSQIQANKNLKIFGPNITPNHHRSGALYELLMEFSSPLIVLLLIIGTFSLFFGDKFSGIIVFVMAALSSLLSFFQEHRAQKAVEKLNSLVQISAQVLRDNKIFSCHGKNIVPGDIVILSAGNIIPADLFIFEAKDLFVSESSITGESMPVEKFGQENPKASKTEKFGFMGSAVVSGTGKGLVVRTAAFTEFGKLSLELSKPKIATSFNKGIKDFTWMMIKFILSLVVIILVVNVLLHRNFYESLLFALAVAIGLAPETLPMIVTVNLSRGALDMSKKKVIVKHLDAIQNFGAMDILCTDKTGTLTRDEVTLEKYCDFSGQENLQTLSYGFLNSFYGTGMKNLLDLAILKHNHPHLTGFEKIDEIPFDFTRRIMTVVVKQEQKNILISKGAPEEIFKRCKFFGQLQDQKSFLGNQLKVANQTFETLSQDGFRVLAVAIKQTEKQQKVFSVSDENNLCLVGFMAFLDPPKETATAAILALKKAGIQIKILTGDNELVTKKICGSIGLDISGVMTGERLATQAQENFSQAVQNSNIFTRLLPAQKQQIILELKKLGHTVGFLGDGINDALALQTADVGISVNNAAEVAKEAAGIILLKKSLTVLVDGVLEGRKVFGNIIKYIRMGASSNFGNMFSMVGASLFLPFLPMAPTQILLNNFLYDVSQVGIPTDNVDPDYLQRPRGWNISLIKKFMLIVGPISSIFDYITFALMWFVFKAYNNPSFFQTGWFLESLLSQTLIIYVIRTKKIPFLQSRPSKFLLSTSLIILAIGLIVPYSYFGRFFQFSQLPGVYFLYLFFIILSYLSLVQVVKNWFVKKFEGE